MFSAIWNAHKSIFNPYPYGAKTPSELILLEKCHFTLLSA
jgi:hypothetical protein